MIPRIPSAEDIVRYLAIHQAIRLLDLSHHIESQFGVRLSCEHKVDRLIIVQMRDGEIETRNIGRTCHAKWVVDNSGVRSVPCSFAWREMYDTEPTGAAYVIPSYLFFLDGVDLLLSERYGPGLIHRLLGAWIGGTVPSIQWTTLWCMGSR